VDVRFKALNKAHDLGLYRITIVLSCAPCRYRDDSFSGD
jgi:hypothetical protein